MLLLRFFRHFVKDCIIFWASGLMAESQSVPFLAYFFSSDAHPEPSNFIFHLLPLEGTLKVNVSGVVTL